MKNKLISYSIFALLGLVLYVWGDGLGWKFGTLTKLQLFPLFGLIAWITMWWHFMLGFVGRIDPNFKRNDKLHRVSGYWVFVSFVLHPALILLFATGLGYSILAAPGNGQISVDFFKLFVGESDYKFVLLGYLSFIIFVAYDVARWLARKPFVKQNWRIIDAASDTAFVLIWIHSLNLGRHLQAGWFRSFWLGLGISGIGFIAYKHYYRYRSMKNSITAP